jgi:uncharacterized damage-inducible protein DinB
VLFMSQEFDALINELDEAYGGHPWHGPSLKTALEGVSASQASRRVIPGAHTIWELVLHLAAWRGETVNRVKGERAGEPKEGDWPPAPQGDAAGDAEWRKALSWLDDGQRTLMAAVRALPPEKLHAPTLDFRERADGRGATCFVTLHGVAQHDAYHAGQISLLKKALH